MAFVNVMRHLREESERDLSVCLFPADTDELEFIRALIDFRTSAYSRADTTLWLMNAAGLSDNTREFMTGLVDIPSLFHSVVCLSTGTSVSIPRCESRVVPAQHWQALSALIETTKAACTEQERPRVRIFLAADDAQALVQDKMGTPVLLELLESVGVTPLQYTRFDEFCD